MRYRTTARPKAVGDGEVALYLPERLISKRDEIALSAAFVTHRRLFGLAYYGIQPDYFDKMPQGSGVYLCPIISTSDLSPGASQPGDIDLLVIPYEGDELILHRVVAIEIKAIRARFERQGKSPNELGISQAQSLLNIGFPYVAVAHLIISDESPRDAWRNTTIYKIVSRNGDVEERGSEPTDLMPLDLTLRAFGRLSKAGLVSPDVGLIAAYLGSNHDNLFGTQAGQSTWHPMCRRASPNGATSRELLGKIASFFEQKASRFIDTPRFDPA